MSTVVAAIQGGDYEKSLPSWPVYFFDPGAALAPAADYYSAYRAAIDVTARQE